VTLVGWSPTPVGLGESLGDMMQEASLADQLAGAALTSPLEEELEATKERNKSLATEVSRVVSRGLRVLPRLHTGSVLPLALRSAQALPSQAEQR